MIDIATRCVIVMSVKKEVQMNNNVAIVGDFFGDEAKAAITNYLCKDNFRYVVRFSGSSNAGHTLYHKGQKIVRHLIPSADFSIKDQFAFLGSDMVINPEELLKEIKDNMNVFPNMAKQIIVDPDAFLITKEHLEEDRENVKTIGSTGKGVTPAYRSKVSRKGIQISSLLANNSEITNALIELGVQFKYSYELYDDFKKSKILFEGAQSILLDQNFGTYPYVTSGSCGLNGVINSGFVSFMPSEVIGVGKCYSTRVGNGPYVTEIVDERGEIIRQKGKEFGATTGRSRRCGWLDLPALKYACVKGGITKLAITKLDILEGMDEIPVCTSYDKELRCGSDFNIVNPIYSNIKGWTDCKDIAQIMPFINMVESYTDTEVKYISCGVGENDIINLQNIKKSTNDIMLMPNSKAFSSIPVFKEAL